MANTTCIIIPQKYQFCLQMDYYFESLSKISDSNFFPLVTVL